MQAFHTPLSFISWKTQDYTNLESLFKPKKKPRYKRNRVIIGQSVTLETRVVESEEKPKFLT